MSSKRGGLAAEHIHKPQTTDCFSYDQETRARPGQYCRALAENDAPEHGELNAFMKNMAWKACILKRPGEDLSVDPLKTIIDILNA